MRLHRSFAVLLLGLPIVRTPIAIVLASARRSPLVATASGRWSPWVPPIRGSSGRSGSELNRSSPRGEASWAFVSTPVPTAMPTAERSAVSA